LTILNLFVILIRYLLTLIIIQRY